MDDRISRLRERVLAGMDLSKEMTDEEIEDLIAKEMAQTAQKHPLSLKERMYLGQQVFNSLRRLDVIQELIDDPAVTEIMVNGPENIFYEKDGAMHHWEGRFASEERLQDVLQQIVARHNRVINRASPIVDTRLADGSRVNIVLNPISLGGSAVTIRKFPDEPFTMDRLVETGSITKEAADALRILVQSKYSIFISGGTGSGKTTFLNALSQYIPSEERIITIEDSAELQIQNVPNLVRLETRNSNMEGVAAITIRDLIRTALRMRPDRIIVGECRGAEAVDMLQAMNTGHDGSLSTGHANSCGDLLSRLEMMVLMGMELPLPVIRRQIASGIDIIIHLGRLRDRSRKLIAVDEIAGIAEGEIVLKELFRFEETGVCVGKVCGEVKMVGSLCHQEKLAAAGMLEAAKKGGLCGLS